MTTHDGDNMTEAEIRAYALAGVAKMTLAVGPAGLHGDAREWRMGTLRFWKSSALAAVKGGAAAFDPQLPLPMHRRGGLTFALFPDMRLEAESFNLKDGRAATAVLLRSDKDPEGTFGTFFLDEKEAHRAIAIVTEEMNATRQIAAARFAAAGGDLAVLDSLRAPSREELDAQLQALLGNPDDE